jgi:hypothetical protein
VPESAAGSYINPVPPEQAAAFPCETAVAPGITPQRCRRPRRDQSTWGKHTQVSMPPPGLMEGGHPAKQPGGNIRRCVGPPRAGPFGLRTHVEKTEARNARVPEHARDRSALWLALASFHG